MAERGVFAVDRGIFDHPMFAPEPYTEREAWLWMLSAAAWADKRIRVGRAVIDLERGQLAFALRFLAVKFKWSEPRVRRFLKRLESDAMVLVSATREATQVTICNYDKYAFGRRTDVREIDAPNDTRTTHPRRKEEEPNNLITKKDSLNADFEAFWEARPKRKGADPKDPARKLYEAAVKAGADPAALLAALQRYARIEAEHVGTPYLPQMVKWLRDKRWADYPEISIQAPSEQLDWEALCSSFKKSGRWSKWAGPDPDSPNCRAPLEVLTKHGLTPLTHDPPTAPVLRAMQ